MIKFQNLINKIVKNRLAQKIFWLFMIIAVWEIVSIFEWVPRFFLPRFSAVIVVLWKDLITGILLQQIYNSLKMMAIGFIISYLIASLMVFLSLKSKVLASFFSTLMTIMNPLPSMALMPLIILWFGILQLAMIILIIHGVVWSTYRYLYDGLKTIPKIYTDFADNIELNLLQKLVHVIIFALAPQIIASLRVGWGRAWRTLISVEILFGMIENIGGVGHYISSGRLYGKMTQVMSGILVIAIIGIMIESIVFNIIERKTIRRWGMFND